MCNLWKTPGVPHKGWICTEVIDLRPDDSSNSANSSADDFYETCEMCGQERIRYLHVMEHEDYDGQLGVGCICAGKMCEDYVGAVQREKEVRNRSNRRANWLKRKWRISSKRNPYLNLRGHNMVVYMYRQDKWGFRIDDEFSSKKYDTENKAKLALFDHFMELEETEDY